MRRVKYSSDNGHQNCVLGVLRVALSAKEDIQIDIVAIDLTTLALCHFC